MKKYMKPLSEIVVVNCREKLMWGELAGSNPDPYAGAPHHPNNAMDQGIDEEAKPIFDKWKNPNWEDEE